MNNSHLPHHPADTIAVLDFGSQYTQLIARRVREAQVYCELFPWNSKPDRVLSIQPRGFILSGGPASIYEPGSPQIPAYILETRLPILGICYGMQALTHTLGGRVAPTSTREFGDATIEINKANKLLSLGKHQVWMSHGDRIEAPPSGFEVFASSQNSPISAIMDSERGYYGLQFHPEVKHTAGGFEIIQRFVIDICKCKPIWTPDNIIHLAVDAIKDQVGNERVIAAVSGGVDSSVAAALVQKAVGDQLTAVFVDTGLLRADETRLVQKSLRSRLGVELITVDAVDRFMTALNDVIDPEEKRLIIGRQFIWEFEQQAQRLGSPRFLVQGTIYPDVVESSAPDRSHAERIKTHHNVGGLPSTMNFELVEPLRYLFKDEVRVVGERLGLPDEIIWRQPFPGPGLAVRCLGQINSGRLDRLRATDKILLEELTYSGWLSLKPTSDRDKLVSQAFAVLLPVRSVGVMGDQRTYGETVGLRAVTTTDFMTADWTRLPHDLLARISTRIVNEVEGVNRVVYDITTKPPATIEWE